MAASHGFWTHPVVGEDKTPVDALLDVAGVVSLLMSLNSTRSNLNTHYYYFFAGASFGSFCGNLITSTDKWFSLGIITPENPWDRYNNIDGEE